MASPVHGSCAAAGDPSQTFDRDGSLFYVLGVAPQNVYNGYDSTFRRIVGSIRIND